MEYKEVIPEVIVGLGEETEFIENEPPFQTVKKLHILLEDWLGDDLMECHPVFIVTENLKNGLKNSNFTGFEFSDMKVTKDVYFSDNYQLKKPIPKFYWLKITGAEQSDDFCLNSNTKRLMISLELNEWLKENFNTKYLTDDTPDVDDFMKRFMESQKK